MSERGRKAFLISYKLFTMALRDVCEIEIPADASVIRVREDHECGGVEVFFESSEFEALPEMGGVYRRPVSERYRGSEEYHQ